MYLYLAGFETSFARDKLPGKNILLSYYYLRKQGDYLDTLQGRNIMIDSGAHTFFAKGGWRGKGKAEDTDRYMDNYILWLIKNYKYITWYYELDIGELTGQEKINKWRDELKKAGIYDKCIPVYHPKVMTINDFYDMVEDVKNYSRYVAVEGLRGKIRNVDYPLCVKYCYDNKIKIHGFAMTKQKYLDLLPFYSVDSSSWVHQLMFLKSNRFTRGRMQPIGSLSKRFNTRINAAPKVISSFIKMERYYTDLWKARGIDWDLILKNENH